MRTCKALPGLCLTFENAPMGRPRLVCRGRTACKHVSWRQQPNPSLCCSKSEINGCSGRVCLRAPLGQGCHALSCPAAHLQHVGQGLPCHGFVSCWTVRCR